MKTSIPLVYGIMVVSAVAYYVNVAEPNNGPFRNEINESNPSEQNHANSEQNSPGLAHQEGPEGKSISVSADQAAPTEIKQSLTAPTRGISVAKPNLIKTVKDEIPADPRALYGTLENGMKYILMRNSTPEARVSMRLHVGAGSLNEAEDQRGVAHFLEHMVFNGTKNFPDSKKLIPKMQRLGIAFGAHANAYTSFDETVYMLDLPNIEEATLDLAFKVMQDFAGGALLEDKEIDEERGVISSEKTSRDSVRFRIMEQQFNKLLPESLIAKRFPIGTDEVIQNAKRERFTDFYTRFYRPKNMCFVYVGDFNLKQAKKQISDCFGELREPPNPGPAPSVGKITSGQGFQTAIFTDKELSSTDLSLTKVNKNLYLPDTSSNRANKLPLAIANRILSRRFSDLILEDPNTPIISGRANRSVYFKELEFGTIDVTAKNSDWKAALPILVREYKRALEHGFTESELNEAKANITTTYANRVRSAPTRKSAVLADSIVANYHNRTVFSTPETDLAIVKEALENLTIKSCNEAFQNFWATPDVFLTLTSAELTQADENVLNALFRNEIVKKTAPPKAQVIKEFAYAKIGQVGTIEKITEIPDLGITQLVLNNGVRVNYKKTNFQADSIQLVANFGGGQLSQPKGKAGIDQMANAVLNMGGLGKHSSQELKGILAGKSVGLFFDIQEDCFTFTGSTTKQDLKLQLQLLSASILDPGFRPQGERLFKAQLPKIYKTLRHSIRGGSNEMQKFLAGNDERFFMPSPKAFDMLTTQDVVDWIAPQLKQSYLEVSIIGDFEEATLKILLNETLGALPERKSEAEDHSLNGKLKIAEFPSKKTFLFESKVPTAIAFNAWRCKKTGDNISELRRLNIISSIMSDRMRVKLREELGQAYSPGAYVNSSSYFENNSYILARCPGKPEDVAKLAQIIEQIADSFASDGASEDELKRALTPTLSSLKKSLQDNSYWLRTVMAESQLKPSKLNWARERDADYASITLEQINFIAKQYLAKSNCAQFIIRPETP